MYKRIITARIHSEEWKIIMIYEIVDCLNVLYDNEFSYNENMFLLANICITCHINILNILHYFI